MKRINQIICLVLMAFAIVLVSCTKEGPQGPPGTDGIDGVDGTDGTDGANGNSTCMECHKNDTDLKLKMNQFEHSAHFIEGAEHTGYGSNYAGGSCSMCHSHDGFKKAVDDGTNYGGIHDKVTPMSCYTCHKIHETYTQDDYELHYYTEVDLYLNENDVFTDLVVDMTNQWSDPEGASNTCAKCHQPRHRGDSQPDPSQSGTIDISAGAAGHWGPHYGAQGAIFGGVGGYIGTTDPTAPSDDKGHHSCKSCHMSSKYVTPATGNYGVYVGGHSMALRNSDDEIPFDKCNECHTDNGATIDLNAMMVSTKAMLDLLGDDLMDAGIMDEEGHLIGGTWTHQQLAAYWNYALVKNDGSYGIHNPHYIEDLIVAARSYLGTN